MNNTFAIEVIDACIWTPSKPRLTMELGIQRSITSPPHIKDRTQSFAFMGRSVTTPLPPSRQWSKSIVSNHSAKEDRSSLLSVRPSLLIQSSHCHSIYKAETSPNLRSQRNSSPPHSPTVCSHRSFSAPCEDQYDEESTHSEGYDSPAFFKQPLALPIDRTIDSSTSSRVLQIRSPDASGVSIEPSEELNVCRVCFKGEGHDELLTHQCAGCKNEERFIHRECLRKWFWIDPDWYTFKCPMCERKYEGQTVLEIAHAKFQHEIANKMVVPSSFTGRVPRNPRSRVIDSNQLIEEHVIAEYLKNEALLLSSLGKDREALNVMHNAMKFNEKVYGTRALQTIYIWNKIGCIYERLGLYKNAVIIFEETLKTQEKIFGPESEALAFTLYYLGNAYSTIRQDKKARPLLERSIALCEKFYGKNSKEISRPFASLGPVYIRCGRINQGHQLLNRALTIRARVYGKTHFECVHPLNELGKLYEKFKEWENSKQFLERSLRIAELRLPANHKIVQSLMRNLKSVEAKIKKNRIVE